MVSNSEQIPDADHRPVGLGEFQRSLAQVNTRIDDLSGRIDDLRSDMNARVDDLRSDMNARSDDLRSDMNARSNDLRSDMNAKSDDLRSEMKTGQAWMRWGIGLMLALTLTLMGLILGGVG